MNILIVTAMFPPIRTGTSFYSKNLAEELIKKGHKVKIVTVKNLDNHEDNYVFSVERLAAFHIPLKNYFKHFRITFLFPPNYIRLWKITKEFQANIILLVNHYQDIAFPAILASMVNKVPLVCSVGTQLQSNNLIRHKILNILEKLICGSLIFPFCNKIIAWDNQILQYLKDVHGHNIVKKLVIINYGVNGEKNAFLNNNQDYSIHGQILGVGAIIEQRNFIPIILAFKEIINDYPNLKLKIIGHIYYNKTTNLVKKLGLEDKIIFTGELPHAQVLEEMKNSDLFFSSLTGKYLGLGTATIESMLMGIPTIANVPFDLLGKPILKDMTDFIYSDCISITELVVKLNNLLSNLELRKKIGENGKKFITKYLNWNLVAKEMEQLFMELTGDKSWLEAAAAKETDI